MLWALIALAVGEACLVHLLVGLLWSGRAAAVLTVASAATIVWLALLIRSFDTHPVTVDDEEVVMRVGTLKGVRFPRAAVAGVGFEVTAAELKARDLLRLSLVAHPNILVRLRAPVAAGRRRIDRVAHRLDDPQGFARALGR